MSHFSVIVATKDEPTEAVLKHELQPFHEFECTGTDDRYVQDVDVTAERYADWQGGSRSKLRDPNGALHCPYDDDFYRDPTEEEKKVIGPIAGTGGNSELSWSSRDWGDGLGYRTKVRFIPEGWESVELPLPSLTTFEEYISDDGVAIVDAGSTPDLEGEHKYGYAVRESGGLRVVSRTNPNSKWDYWRVGGRYAGKFQIKGRRPERRHDLSYEWSDAKESELPTGVDSCRLSELDVELMKAEAVASRRSYWESCLEKSELNEADLLAAIHSQSTVHAKWLELPEPRPRGSDYYAWADENGGFQVSALSRLLDPPKIAAGQTVEQWIAAAPFLTCFAFLMDGKWAAEGDMGWWACVSNENANWHSDFMRIFETVPDGHWLTVVDCHT